MKQRISGKPQLKQENFRCFLTSTKNESLWIRIVSELAGRDTRSSPSNSTSHRRNRTADTLMTSPLHKGCSDRWRWTASARLHSVWWTHPPKRWRKRKGTSTSTYTSAYTTSGHGWPGWRWLTGGPSCSGTARRSSTRPVGKPQVPSPCRRRSFRQSIRDSGRKHSGLISWPQTKENKNTEG